MFALIARLARFLSISKAPSRYRSVPGALLETAEARAGLGFREASELRQAAFAYLRVVR
ncbi:MAG TPA: hypothetical protein VK996_09765 [Ramlibacter sp.]|nr:hypothetical protein [Ramlibacter sp.]